MEFGLFFLMDISENIIKGYLLFYLLSNILSVKVQFKGPWKKYIPKLIILQFIVIQMILTYLPVVKKILYGVSMVPSNGNTSFLVIIVSMCATTGICFFIYQDSKSEILYLVFTVYTLSELARFTLHSVFIMLLNGAIGMINHFISVGNRFAITHIAVIFWSLQLVWNLFALITYLLLFYFILRQLKKQLQPEKRKLKRNEIAFLAVPSAIGFCFSILLRSIMYSIQGEEIHFLLEDNPETYILVPGISALCIISILIATKVLNSLVKNSEKEIQLGIYRNQIIDMEVHIKDVEHLYDGISGMKHDMKNYVADIEALLRGAEYNATNYETEMKHYLDGLCDAMEQLDMKYKTGNPVTDVVINRKMREASNNGVQFTCEFIYPQGLKISAFDLSIILNNALENALEAISGHVNGSFISLSSYSRKNMFFIIVQNSFNGSLQYDASEQLLVTTKDEAKFHGLGLKNIKNCAEKYFGKSECSIRENVFTLTVMLQGNNSLHNKDNSLHCYTDIK